MKHIVVMVCGLPGSGKSYFASRMAKKLKAVYLNSDRLRKELAGETHYSYHEKRRVYNEMLRRSREALLADRSVVLDATFYKASIRREFIRKLARIRLSRMVIIEIRAGRRITKQRLSHPRPFSEADFNVFEMIEKQWEPISEKHLLLRSTISNIDTMLEKAIDYLRDSK